MAPPSERPATRECLVFPWSHLDGRARTMQDVGGSFGIYLEELAMAFGKPGRPPEDRLARPREIYEAVIPLIYRDGARRLSMRSAARAAHMSVGGLYHYFPAKRDLVLHGLREDARDRV